MIALIRRVLGIRYIPVDNGIYSGWAVMLDRRGVLESTPHRHLTQEQAVAIADQLNSSWFPKW